MIQGKKYCEATHAVGFWNQSDLESSLCLQWTSSYELAWVWNPLLNDFIAAAHFAHTYSDIIVTIEP
jgi:hypothetical protein